ncbi:MAG: DUF4040 domain-containing protein [Planctomycetes bacterium]|nr:DUF4040 domain-containing protein [Planctomycetota bacterium]
MLWTILLLFGLAAAAPLVAKFAKGASGWLLAAGPAAILFAYLAQLPILPGESRSEVWEWVPGLGVELRFVLDGLSATFTLLITGIGALVLVYAGGYMAGKAKLGQLLSYLLLFLGSMLGLVLSDNTIALFVFWELTSISSYLLIGLDHERESVRSAALKALLVTGGGGLLLLGGFVLLGIAAGDLGLKGADAFSISALADLDLSAHGLYPAIMVLVAIGAFTKSAQAPFHFWLPQAMAAPTPVSALLHSATMVKAGIFLLARLHPALGGTDLWTALLVPVGAVTMLGAAITALGQRDKKRILAYSTVSVLGILVTLLGAGTVVAIEAAVVLLVAHAFYKAALFMVAGNVDHGAGTRDVTLLSGLRKAMPFTFAAGAVAALSMAGAPPMFGFVGKELFYGKLVTAEARSTLLILVAVATNVALVAAALLVALRPFVGSSAGVAKNAHEVSAPMLVGPLILAAAGLFVGLFPDVFDATLGSAMATAIAGQRVDMHLALWHGLNPTALGVMGLSAATLVLGAMVYHRTRRLLAPLAEALSRLRAIGPETWYEKGLAGLVTGSDRVTRGIQTGYLRHYVLAVVVAAVVLAAPPLLRSLPGAAPLFPEAPRPHEALLVAVAAASAVAAMVLRSRTAAIAALGATGAVIAMLFLLFSAPDLSITQIMVETLSVILLVLVLSRLPRLVTRSSRSRRIADLAVATLAGGTMALLAIAATTVSLDPEAARFFAAASYTEAQGRNVVNVVLVDFRALDTMGEIFVVAAAGFGIHALLRLAPETGGAA